MGLSLLPAKTWFKFNPSCLRYVCSLESGAERVQYTHAPWRCRLACTVAVSWTLTSTQLLRLRVSTCATLRLAPASWIRCLLSGYLAPPQSDRKPVCTSTEYSLISTSPVGVLIPVRSIWSSLPTALTMPSKCLLVQHRRRLPMCSRSWLSRECECVLVLFPDPNNPSEDRLQYRSQVILQVILAGFGNKTKWVLLKVGDAKLHNLNLLAMALSSPSQPILWLPRV